MELFKSFPTLYKISSLLKTFHGHTMFDGIVSRFLGFSMVRFQMMFLKISSLVRAFEDPFNDILYFL